MITDKRIDNGKAFDWGKTSADYAKYRDIYPREFYERIHSLGIAEKGQRVLDIGTGTGVLPRNMCEYGAHFTGTDIAENQIEYAKKLAMAADMKIDFLCSSTEELEFPDGSFDAITACQCFFYFDHERLAPKAARMLSDGGRLAVLYMAWLPFDDKIAGESEKLVLKYNPVWSGCGEKRHEINIPEVYNEYFEREAELVFDVNVPFTRESWNGRIKACRGIGASLSSEEIARFEQEHKRLLENIAPENFDILHYYAITVLKKKA